MNLFKKIFRSSKISGGDPRTPQYWMQKLFGNTESSAGIVVNHDTALKYSPVWAAVNIISGAIGFLPINVYRQTDDGKQSKFTHSVQYLLHNRPNKYMTALTFRETMQSHVLLWGNAYAEIERNGAGEPIGLWPLMPNTVEPKIENFRRENILIYEITENGCQRKKFFDDILHIPGLGWSGLKGYSVIDYCLDNIGLGLAAEKNSAVFFKNDSTPPGLLTTESMISSDKERDAIKKQWQAAQGGLDKKFKIPVLHSGLKYQPVGANAKDAQLIEARKYGISDVSRWFQIPAHFLGDLENSHFNNIEHTGIEFVVWTLDRWLKKWEQECNYKLFSGFEQKRYFVEFNVDALLRGDVKTRNQAFLMGRNGGWLSVNDIRRKENMNPIEGGDTYLEPLNMQIVGSQKRFAPLYEDSKQRMLTKEINSLKLKLKKDDFNARDFYAGHKAFVASVWQPIFSARFGTMAGATKALDFAESYIEKRIAALESGRKPEDLFDEWKNETIEVRL